MITHFMKDKKNVWNNEKEESSQQHKVDITDQIFNMDFQFWAFWAVSGQ